MTRSYVASREEIAEDLTEIRRHLNHMLKATRTGRLDLRRVLEGDLGEIRGLLDVVDMRIVTVKVPFGGDAA